MEETGVAIDVVSRSLPVTGDSDAFLLPAPLCVHAVKATEQGVDYYHIDFCFLGQPRNAMELPSINHTDDVLSAQWFALAELNQVPLAKNVIEVVALATKST